LAAVALLAAVAGAQAPRERWRVQFIHDEDEETLQFVDLAFPSAKRGVAVGVLTKGERRQAVAMVTSDGGLKWDQVKLKDEPLSLFFLDETRGWVVTDGGVYETSEAGRTWKKIRAPKNVLEVYFTTPQRGFAAGLRKQAWHTSDGGINWTKIAAAAQATGNPDHSAYNVIAFAGAKLGMIGGFNRPPRRNAPRLPAWIEPEERPRRRQIPNLMLLLQTTDGGATWTSQTASVFGTLSTLDLSAEGVGLALIEFLDDFEIPSEVHALDLRSGKSTSIFRRKDRAVTDLKAVPGAVYLAAVEPTGQLARSPIPGALRILRSRDLKNWEEMEVDYRASANRVVLAAAGNEVWAATDTGMILKLGQ
jgi:photosystem II stability/assembly factor-like uncharacterized protein